MHGQSVKAVNFPVPCEELVMPEQSQARGEINELPVCWDFMPLGSPTFCMDSVSICLYANDAPELTASADGIQFGRDSLQLIGQPSFQKSFDVD